MSERTIPKLFLQLQTVGCIDAAEVANTPDGFWLLQKSLSDILSEKGIRDFVDSANEKLLCDHFFDDWFLYAVSGERGHAYSLLKLREQEQDAKDCAPADGDTPGVTVSFISFKEGVLLDCLAEPTDENRKRCH